MNNKILTHRRQLIPYLAKKIKAKSYLEIGVKGGKTFFPVPVFRKYAVDPQFNIKTNYQIKQSIKYIPNIWAKFYECTSDEFFKNHAENIFENNHLDMAFIDGLHTAEQTYLDVLNTLPYVNQNGLIILHDCSPKSSAAAYPATSIQEAKRINPPGFDGRWSGDVWKVIPMLRINKPDLFIFVIDHDSGIGIITQKPILPHKFYQPISLDLEKINTADYSLLDKSRNQILNLISDNDILTHCELFN